MSKKNTSSHTKVNFYIHPLISANDFLARIKRNPFSIVYDFDVRSAVEELRETCRNEINEESNRAKSLLKKAGLSAFIPPQATKRRTKYQELFEFQSDPLYFRNLVGNIAEQLKTLLEESRKKRHKDKLKEAFEHILRKTLTEQDVGKLRAGDRSKDFTSLALSLLSDSRNIPFPNLKKFYYSDKMDLFRDEEVWIAHLKSTWSNIEKRHQKKVPPQKHHKHNDRNTTFKDYWSYLGELEEIKSLIFNLDRNGQKYKVYREDKKAMIKIFDNGKWFAGSLILYGDRPDPSSCKHLQQCKDCGKILPAQQEN